ncbi:hypothetical protein COCON_G00122430 [Conger conger]|uniref:E3 ubiquitin-protein ligase Topors n=1 Tax=Conger conger TaxID=82655 RepID=A0A9Q1HYS8_CONCO|nr:hypothetical protein COCON_G00122430 [Conger conger]
MHFMPLFFCRLVQKMAPTKMKLRMRKKDGSSKALQSMSAEASPDSKCPICLDRFNNMAYLDRCLHKFCFRCIHEWSKNKAECPLCKQPFNSIFHTIKAENDFKEFVLRTSENGSFSSPGALRLRYSTTQTRESRQSPGRTSPPPDNGVIFEGLTGSAPLQQDRGIHRMMMRLATRRRAQSKGRMVRHLREQEMVRFRRALYRTGVRVRSVRDGGRHRDISAAFYQRNPACLHRLVPWLKRELTVLYGTHGSLVNIVQHIIMSWITRYDMDQQAIQEELRPFLLARTDHFLHELISFARSPFNMEAYDQHAVYDCPAPSSLEGSSSDSSVIAISEDEEAEAELARRPVSATGSGLSQAPWDDETPGPSYSTAEQTLSPSLSLSESESESGRSAGRGAEAQQGTLPMAERTPELVQLSSDSEESAPEETPKDPEPLQLLRFPSLSPPSSAGSPPPKRKSPCVQGEGMSDESAQPADEGPFATEAHGGDCYADGDAALVPTVGSCWRDECDPKKDHGSHGRQERSGDAALSCSLRSPTISVHSDSPLSRERVRSRSGSKDLLSSRDRARERRREKDAGQPRRGHTNAAFSYHWESYSHYSRGSGTGGVLYTQSRAFRSRLYTSPDRSSRSRSRSPRPTRHRGRRRSRSRSSSSSCSGPRRARHDKPGGKRKYKTRHLEETAKGRAQKALAVSAAAALKERRGNGERRRRKSRKKSRSPSVEIVYEGRATGDARKHPKKRRKHKKRSRRRKSRELPECRSPTVITIDSDSTVDISDLVVDVSGQTVDAAEHTCPVGSENEVSATIGPLSDANLLESILQDLQQHILPVDQDSTASVSNTEAAAAELSLDSDKCNMLHGENKHYALSSDDEASGASPVITIESHFIEPMGLEEAPDTNAVCRSD